MRQLLCRRVEHDAWTVGEVAEAAGCSERTAFRWLARSRGRGTDARPVVAPEAGLGTAPRPVVTSIEELRRLRWTSTRIAVALKIAVSRVCGAARLTPRSCEPVLRRSSARKR